MLNAPSTSRVSRYVQRRGDAIVGRQLHRLVRQGQIRLLPHRLIAAGGRQVTLTDGSELPVSSVLWCTGFTPDTEWIQIAGAIDRAGMPVHDRGASPVTGLHWMGLPWQTRLSLRVGERHPRDDAVVELSRAAGQAGQQTSERVTGGQPALLVPDVSELQRTGAVPGGVHVLGAGAQIAVGDDLAVLADVDPGLVQVDPGGGRGAADRDQQMRTTHGLAVGQVHARPGADPLHSGTGAHLDAVTLEHSGENPGDLGFLLDQDPRCGPDEGDPAAELREGLRDLDADRLAAQHEQVRGWTPAPATLLSATWTACAA